MRRRRLLGHLCVGLGLGTAGCASEIGNQPSETATGEPTDENTRTAPPEYDCAEASRPTLIEDVRARGDTVEPRPYPDGPPPLGDESAVAEYVTQYERAYVQKKLQNDVHGPLVGFGFGNPESDTFKIPMAAAVVRLRYTYYYEVDRDDGGPVHADSPTNYATYYVDDSVIVRAHREGFLDDEREQALIPDPWESGYPVECFD